MTILLAPNRHRSTNPAQCSITGSISNGADWIETLTIVDGESDQVTGVGSDTWVIQLRADSTDTTAEATLTTATELTITVGATTTLAIDCDQATISGLLGDYTMDIVSETSGGDSTHRAHGKITVHGSPVAI